MFIHPGFFPWVCILPVCLASLPCLPVVGFVTHCLSWSLVLWLKQALQIPPVQSVQSSIDLVWHLLLLGSQSWAAGQVAAEADSQGHNCLNSHNCLHNSRLLLNGEGMAWGSLQWVGKGQWSVFWEPQSSRALKRHCYRTLYLKGSCL